MTTTRITSHPPLVSIIIPAFNAERTINRCLDSIVSQTLKDIEIICIDDGSTDRTRSLLDTYAQNDARILVFHQHNKGISSARNTGILNASGDYIGFVDADDYVSHMMYESLYRAAVLSGALMVVSDYWQITGEQKDYVDQSSQTGDSHSLISRMFSWCQTSVNNRLFRRQALPIMFDERITYMEDKLFLTNLLQIWEKTFPTLPVHHIPQALYYYDTTSNSLSLSKQPKGILLRKTVTAFDAIYGVVDQPAYAVPYYNFMLELAFNAFWNAKSLYGLSSHAYQEIFGHLRQGISEYTSSCPQKRVVLKSIDRGLTATKWMRWLLVPAILKDKIRDAQH